MSWADCGESCVGEVWHTVSAAPSRKKKCETNQQKTTTCQQKSAKHQQKPSKMTDLLSG